MIQGETVKVYQRVEVGRDPGNNPIYEDQILEVEDVLVAPASLTDITGPNRPDGVQLNYTLHFPKTFTGDLTGARISIRDRKPLSVVGSPDRYSEANTPGRWNMPVNLSEVEG